MAVQKLLTTLRKLRVDKYMLGISKRKCSEYWYQNITPNIHCVKVKFD
jgi:hypothetical protein